MTVSGSKTHQSLSSQTLSELAVQIKQWAKDLGFDAVGISNTHLDQHEKWLNEWLAKGMHGEMTFMHKHGTKRTRPEELVHGTKRVISVRMDYAPADIKLAHDALSNSDIGYISRYALGRDYHKVLRQRLKRLANKIQERIGDYGYRVFTDSAPVMEKALAEKAGLGWIGKHSNLLHSKSGSWFFLGELYVDLELPTDEASTNHCGSCTQCIDLCPTKAIVGPYQVDARRCISYLTIELKGSIPLEFRSLIGNRIYGCDDCQIVCPWNKFAQPTKEIDFSPRSQLTDQDLITLMSWSEDDFLRNTEGNAIRRIGYQAWIRNIAIAMGNALSKSQDLGTSKRMIETLIVKRDDETTGAMAREHIEWALECQSNSTCTDH